VRHAEQVRLLQGLMRHLDEGTNVDAGRQVHNPVASYTSEDLAAREWAALFQGHPQVVGLSGDLPWEQSFFTSNDLGKPILCTRAPDGQFRAFLNVCRHRGSVVETEARGTRKVFRCPFHAWTYDHEGRLARIPKPAQFGKVDRRGHALVPLPAVERHGILWLSPDPQGELDVDACLGKLGPELRSWKLERYERHGERRYDHASNWKEAIDTYGETYHFNTLHRSTLAKSFYGNVQMYDVFGRNHRVILCMRAIDGLRKKTQKTWHILQGAVPVYYLFPNVQLFLTAAGPILVRVYPDGANPHRSWSQLSFYMDPDLLDRDFASALADEGASASQPFFAARMEALASVIEAEDYVAAASMHRGALSGAQEFVLFGRNEPALHHFHDACRQALGMPPLESTKAG
jgi:phenylpropionate dioxygenase-like ring-hydroxylating dioxygenase large terminal subunit